MSARVRPAPIAYFGFNRPWHARRTLAALAANSQAADSELHVFVDGARSAAEQPLVDEVIAAARAATGFGRVELHAAAANQGLYAAITGGVSLLLRTHGRVIVVEDDVLVSTHFLAYMNDALERYGPEPRVGCIHGYSPPLPGLPEFFFLRGADCWGWATWSDRWPLFRGDAGGLLSELANGHRLTEFTESHGWESLLLLARRARGDNQSWAILWHASLFLADRLTLHPGRSFVRNIGVDGSGMHSGSDDIYGSESRRDYAGLPELPIENDPRSARRLRDFMDGAGGGGPAAWLRPSLRRWHALFATRRALSGRGEPQGPAA